jgi:uncharacterized protein (TIGR02453 family)
VGLGGSGCERELRLGGSTLTEFAGFPEDAIGFLVALREHNDRDWFHAHRDDYERFLLEPARDFVAAMGDELGPEVHADPRVNGSIFRINRDTRFSKDKRPYKDHLDLWFWQGDGPSRTCPGYWFRLTPELLMLGAGMHRFEGDALTRYREAVADPERGAELSRAASGLPEEYRLGGRTYKRIPAGYDADPARVDMLLHSGLYAGLELPLPPETHTPSFPAFCAGHYRRMAPVLEWLVDLG